MEIVFTDIAYEHLQYFQSQNQTIILKKVREIIESITKSPFIGIGKPEPLKYKYSGCWSRRISKEHRLIYKVEDNCCTILSLKGHYE
ncbi:MAG: Txe/YoeB family addiction module toxin [Chitinophagales bacterium]|jgi:toxin YoeB|nr:Txe/YoeB family addiction module toxin [Sphingobacteriales bacterium]